MSQNRQNNEDRHPTYEQSNFCANFIPLMTLGLLSFIFYCYIDSRELLSSRINKTQSPISNYLPIYSGEIHYSRVVPQYWQHRVKMIKSMGFNSLSVYVMWNYHELSRGVFDFESPDKNLKDFLDIAKKLNMHVLLRPGPYVCAEWDFGGLPARLLGIQDLKIRSHNSLYESEVLIYFKALAEQIRPYLSKNGGPIIMLQIQNELGSYNRDSAHTQALIKMWKSLKIESQFYIEDAPWFYEKHYWPGAHIGLSEGGTIRDFTDIEISSKRTNNSLVFGGEIYSGWLTHWGEEMNGRTYDEFSEHFHNLVRANRSVSLYVAHGGTNFGLTAGANGFPNNDYMPHITSYDYDAPITQRGTPTKKYTFIRQTLKKYNKIQLSQIPQQFQIIKIPQIILKKHTYLFQNLPQATLKNENLTYFQSNKLQMYDQGFVLYQTVVKGKGNHLFNVTFRDFMLIYVDDMFRGNLSREKIPSQLFQINCQREQCKIKLLVQAMGHINYGKKQDFDRKGLISFVQIKSYDDDSVVSASYLWNISKIPIDKEMAFWKDIPSSLSLPIMRSGNFNVDKIGDTFFDLSRYGKGYLWVNDHLLGRYWNRGPQQRLYCPGPWLKQGENDIRILQLLQKEQHEITSEKSAE